MKVTFFDNLQFKVTLVFLLVSLVPLSIVSVFSVRTAERVIVSIVQNQLENVAAEKQDLLQRWITERNADLEVVARSELVKSMEPAKIAPYVELVRSRYKVYKRFVIAGEDGQVVYDSAGSPGGVLADEVWHQQAMQGQPYMSPVRLEASGGESVFLLSAPILDARERSQGAVCATVSTRSILAGVLRVSLGKTGECYLVDEAGTFLAHKEPRRILHENIARSESFAQLFGADQSRPVYTDYRGIPVLGASRAVADTPWYLVVEQDRDEAFQRSHQLKRNVYTVIALTVTGAVGLSWFLAWYVTAPIRVLSGAAYALARGEYEDAVPHIRTTRRDEIGALYADFKHMATQLEDRHARLQTRVGLTEAELRKVEAKLKGTMEAAARSERLAALGRLASGVAHEIRTPLTSLKLFLQSVQDEIAISPEQSEDYQIAMRQVGRIETTINHFLNFARPQEPVLETLDFVELVHNALEVVQPRANQQEVEVHAQIAPELPSVEGDVRQLGEVLVNLLVNALEAMPDGGQLRISVTAETAPPGSEAYSCVRIDVSDTGPGIAEENQDRLFEPFFTTKARGSGLGLAIVRGTVERHGGTIHLHTQLQAGTTFSICLPIATQRRTAEHGQNPDCR